MISFTFLGLGPKTEWYVVFHKHGDTIHKCARDNYLEMREYFEINEFKIDYRNYLYWEQKQKFKDQR